MLHGHTLEEVELQNCLQMFVLMVLTITKKTVNRVDVLFIRRMLDISVANAKSDCIMTKAQNVPSCIIPRISKISL